MLIEWSDAFSVGVREIDEDHKRFLGIFNRFYGAFIAGANHASVLAALTEIADYAGRHFDQEERVMRKYRFPHLERHVRHHSEMLNRIDRILVDFEVGEMEMPEKILDFLRDWIVAHLSTYDRELGEWVKANTAGT